MANSVLTGIFLKGLDCDIVLAVENDEREIKAHRLILKGASKFFEGLFDSGFKEEDSNKITLNQMTFEVLQAVITFIYTMEWNFSPQCTKKDAILAADYLIVDCAIESLSEVVIVISIKPDDELVEIYTVADKLTISAKEFLADNIRSNLESLTAVLEILSFEQFLGILKNSKKVTLDEKVTILAIKQWILATDTTEDRLQYTFELLSAVIFNKKVEYQFLIQNLVPICQCVKSLQFLVALQARNRNFSDAFVKQFFDDTRHKFSPNFCCNRYYNYKYCTIDNLCDSCKTRDNNC